MSISNISSVNYTKIPVNARIKNDLMWLKTHFHKFLTSSDKVYSELLCNVLYDHTEENFISKEECILLLKFKLNINITIYLNEQCIPMNKTMVKPTDLFISILTSKKHYVTFKVWTYATNKKQIILEKMYFKYW